MWLIHLQVFVPEQQRAGSSWYPCPVTGPLAPSCVQVPKRLFSVMTAQEGERRSEGRRIKALFLAGPISPEEARLGFSHISEIDLTVYEALVSLKMGLNLHTAHPFPSLSWRHF